MSNSKPALLNERLTQLQTERLASNVITHPPIEQFSPLSSLQSLTLLPCCFAPGSSFHNIQMSEIIAHYIEVLQTTHNP